ncbi:hypothetical protein PTSG_01386 [Salpingoeca rosetta]|uniref:Uncharacterized protein n=1 Tax=Salpingoeca rosetta (strain ATCC 50818 / BSB-021) TaxID=946362 RepID=F2U069_SALR5|nr:uncharacterized protein PTSG_01386 [Salpingoeca rosetta]EGD80797.1 hypothetical protein PTSG_01386 [Salpingoeca rosetta]|eukprot:XP_004997358.1 hypothetical protein PTSG_01386 [Salpingoeca rosetta]
MAVSGTVIGAAATTVGSVLLLNVAGILTARFPRHRSGKVGPSGIVPDRALAPLSSLVTNVFLPCLIFSSLGATLRQDVLKDSWPSAVFAPVNMGIAALVSWLVAIPFVPRKFRTEFVLASSVPNVGPMPLVMMEVLCDQEQLASETDCFDRSVTFIFVHVFGWSLAFWTIGLALVKSMKGDHGQQQHEPKRSLGCAVARGLASPAILATILGAVVGLIQPLRRAFFSDHAPLRFIASAASNYGTSVVGLAIYVMAATLGKSLTSLNPRAWIARKRAQDTHASKQHPCLDGSQLQDVHGNRTQHRQQDSGAGSSSGSTNETHSSSSSGALEMQPQLQLQQQQQLLLLQQQLQQQQQQQRDEGGDSSESLEEWLRASEGNNAEAATVQESTLHQMDSPDSAATTTAVIVEMTQSEDIHANMSERSSVEDIERGAFESDDGRGVAHGHNSSKNEHGADAAVDDEGWSATVIVLFIFVSMCVVPVLRFGLLLLVGDLVFVGPDSALVQLVVALQSVTPAATLVVVVCQREGKQAAAKRISRGVVGQYAFSIVTLLVATVIAVDSFYS